MDALSRIVGLLHLTLNPIEGVIGWIIDCFPIYNAQQLDQVPDRCFPSRPLISTRSFHTGWTGAPSLGLH